MHSPAELQVYDRFVNGPAKLMAELPMPNVSSQDAPASDLRALNVVTFPTSGRTKILVLDGMLHAAVEASALAVGTHPNVFERGESLVHLVSTRETMDMLGPPVVRPLSAALLKQGRRRRQV
jgi:hypothetical protein